MTQLALYDLPDDYYAQFVSRVEQVTRDEVSRVMTRHTDPDRITTLVVGDLDVDDWDAMIDVNLRGVLNGIAAALPVFRRQGRGHFVTTVSTSGLKIVPGQAVYAGTKNAVRTLLEALRQESTDGVVRTTSVSPGYVRTELATASIDHPETRAQIEAQMTKIAIAPEAIARAIAFAITIGFDANLSASFDICSYLSVATRYGVSLSRPRFATAVASKFVRITPGSIRATSIPNGRSS